MVPKVGATVRAAALLRAPEGEEVVSASSLTSMSREHWWAPVEYWLQGVGETVLVSPLALNRSKNAVPLLIGAKETSPESDEEEKGRKLKLLRALVARVACRATSPPCEAPLEVTPFRVATEEPPIRFALRISALSA